MVAITTTRTESLTVNVTEKELGAALHQIAWERCGQPDDPGVDWYTSGDTTYLAGEDWPVSRDPQTARIVDAANILEFGQIMTVDTVRAARTAQEGAGR